MKQTVAVDKAFDRLDQAIAAMVVGVSRRRARTLIAEGAVYVEGKRCRVASRRVPVGTRIVVHTETDTTIPEVVVLYEDDQIVVVDKPAGVHVNETETTPRHSLEWILSERNVHVVHRLDVDTTGVLLFAKSRRMAAILSEAFAAREVEKVYFAVTSGRPEVVGTIDRPIGPDRRRQRAKRVVDTGKAAVTEVAVVAEAHGLAAVVARPKTGRTHQIRVHLADLKAPIVGDILYGGPGAVALPSGVLDIGRPLLHAASLAVVVDGVRRRFDAPIPPDIGQLAPVGLSFGGAAGLASDA